MRSIKKLVRALTLAVTLGTSVNILNADCCPLEACDGDCDDGCGYEECCTAPSLSPTVALGAIALVAVATVIVHNRGNSSNCYHGH